MASKANESIGNGDKRRSDRIWELVSRAGIAVVVGIAVWARTIDQRVGLIESNRFTNNDFLVKTTDMREKLDATHDDLRRLIAALAERLARLEAKDRYK